MNEGQIKNYTVSLSVFNEYLGELSTFSFPSVYPKEGPDPKDVDTYAKQKRALIKMLSLKDVGSFVPLSATQSGKEITIELVLY